MKTVILHDGMIKDVTIHKNFEVIDTRMLDIKPCYNCGKCQSSGTGICVNPDDIGIALYAICSAQRLVIVSNVWYGTYAPSIKKVLDKLMLTGGNPFFRIHKGKIAHESGSKLKEWIVLGYKDSCSKEEETIFHTLVSENADITDTPYHKSYIVETKHFETSWNQMVGSFI